MYINIYKILINGIQERLKTNYNRNNKTRLLENVGISKPKNGK